MYFICNDDTKTFRSNPIVVAVVEELRKEADRTYTELKVIDIPFDTVEGWDINDYDGVECIAETHRTWE